MPSRFDAAYEGRPPWDIGRPQPEVQAIEAEGGFSGRVLDAGCGTGENALFLAAKGHDVTGIDFSAPAIHRAKEKASARGIKVDFRVWDALEIDALDIQFDSALDCGMFHVFDDEERARYVESLGAVIKPGGRLHVLCFSDREPPGWGPRRVSQDEIRQAFARGWRIEEVRPTFFAHAIAPPRVHAWRATMERQ